ncbi:MAG: TlpA disulfide reductase family protein [Segetibacter sp.]
MTTCSYHCDSFFFTNTKEKFEITGILSGFADSTLIYLDDVPTSSPVHIDSTLVINNQFHFSGSIKGEVSNVILRTKTFSDYKFFWLENSAITFKAEKGKFRQATIIGSGTQNEQNQLDAAIKKAGKEKEQCILFIQNHPNSIISANILSVYSSTWGKDTATILYRKLSKKIKNTIYGQNILAFITLNKNIKVGNKYVDFTEQNVEGKNVSLSDYNGKIVLLEFWGSWCGPCREGNPELVKIYNEFKNAGFEILGVAADDNKELWINAIQKDSLNWPNVTDLKGDKNKAVLVYGISYYPANFLIDRNGFIIAKDLRGEALRNKLRQILK